jgi:hypothetical protein
MAVCGAARPGAGSSRLRTAPARATPDYKLLHRSGHVPRASRVRNCAPGSSALSELLPPDPPPTSETQDHPQVFALAAPDRTLADTLGSDSASRHAPQWDHATTAQMRTPEAMAVCDSAESVSVSPSRHAHHFAAVRFQALRSIAVAIRCGRRPPEEPAANPRRAPLRIRSRQRASALSEEQGQRRYPASYLSPGPPHHLPASTAYRRTVHRPTVHRLSCGHRRRPAPPPKASGCVTVGFCLLPGVRSGAQCQCQRSAATPRSGVTGTASSPVRPPVTVPASCFLV